jgi:hypothetical protein
VCHDCFGGGRLSPCRSGHALARGNLTLTPKDPALAARQLKTDLAEGEVLNAIEGFELKKLGTGRIFERTAEEISAGKAPGKNLPKFCGHALVLLPSGRVMSTSQPGTGRGTTSTQATPPCMMWKPPPKHALPELAGHRPARSRAGAYRCSGTASNSSARCSHLFLELAPQLTRSSRAQLRNVSIKLAGRPPPRSARAALRRATDKSGLPIESDRTGQSV